MNQVTEPIASPFIVPAFGLLWPTLLGRCFLEPSLPQVSSPSMTKYETRITRPYGTWLPEILSLQLGSKGPVRA